MNKLLHIMKSLIRNLLFCLAFLPFVLVADVYFVETGQLTKITNKQILVGDLVYKLLPTFKVFLKTGKSGTVEQLKKGDNIRLKILNLDRKYFVESIHQLADQSEDQESNAGEGN
ncbi:MAG: hypothetical protein GY763_03620 [Gammaproteobacteria bacterium]|nr:hypothetical protein [Gammaproteobacteria bacterium]